MAISLRAVVGRLVIDLCDQRRLLGDRIDARLTPSAESCGWIDGDKLSIGLTLQPHGSLISQGLPGAASGHHRHVA